MGIQIRPVSIEDYDGIFELWNSTEQSRRALNPLEQYGAIKTCFESDR